MPEPLNGLANFDGPGAALMATGVVLSEAQYENEREWILILAQLNLDGRGRRWRQCKSS